MEIDMDILRMVISGVVWIICLAITGSTVKFGLSSYFRFKGQQLSAANKADARTDALEKMGERST